MENAHVSLTAEETASQPSCEIRDNTAEQNSDLCFVQRHKPVSDVELFYTVSLVLDRTRSNRRSVVGNLGGG